MVTPISSSELRLPARAGVSLKPSHYRVILESLPNVGFFEVHAENYMGGGGPPHRYLTAIREHYPLSIHGVGLSIGGAEPLDRGHLGQLVELVRRYQPRAVSEHLAWSSHDGVFLNDLLPIPYTRQMLQLVCDHVDEAQSALCRPILIENPSTYLAFGKADYSEADFISEVVGRTGCGLLLDVANVHVSSTNHDRDALRFLADLPLAEVGEIHLAGFATREDRQGRPLLIDSHDRAVDENVWALYAYVLDQLGPTPTLIERDADIPEWDALAAEAHHADGLIFSALEEEPFRVAAA